MTRHEDGGAARSRRTLVGAIAAGAAAAGSHRALAQAERGVPPSVVTSPPRQFGPHAPPNVYLDPDIVIVDPLLTQYVQGNAPIQRLWTGALWSEGAARAGISRQTVALCSLCRYPGCRAGITGAPPRRVESSSREFSVPRARSLRLSAQKSWQYCE
jgi:hypothetical protein